MQLIQAFSPVFECLDVILESILNRLFFKCYIFYDWDYNLHGPMCAVVQHYLRGCHVGAPCHRGAYANMSRAFGRLQLSPPNFLRSTLLDARRHSMLRNASSLLATHRGLSALCTAFSTSSPHRLPADSADAATSVTLSSESEPPRRARRRDSDDGQGEAEPYREESRPSRGAQKFRPRDESREDTPRREFRTNVRRPREDRPTREYIPRDRQPREDRPARESFTPRQPREGTSTREFIYRQAREEKPTREFKRYDRGPRQSPTDQEGGRRLLRPPELARRLQALAARGLVDDAAEMLQNAPLDAQNLVVWNTMIKLAMEARKFKLGYSLYTDVSLTSVCGSLYWLSDTSYR